MVIYFHLAPVPVEVSFRYGKTQAQVVNIGYACARSGVPSHTLSLR